MNARIMKPTAFFVPLLLCNSLWGYGKNDRESKMNIVYIMTDDHSYQTISASVSYTHLRAHETVLDLVCRLVLMADLWANWLPHQIWIVWQPRECFFNEHLWKILFPLLRVRV